MTTRVPVETLPDLSQFSNLVNTEEDVNLQVLPYMMEGYSQQFVDLPSGTLLFRANYISPENDGRGFFFDFLGLPTETGFCFSPVHNIFTFPFPYVGFGLNIGLKEFRSAWSKFNCINIYVLKCSVPMVNMIAPSKEIRGTTKDRAKYTTAPIRRCDTFGAACATSPEERRIQTKYLTYDNCIDPAFRNSTGCSGYIAIAANDSLDVKDKKIRPDKTTMGQYLQLLSQTNPEEALTIASNLYVDAYGHRGIPELVFHSVKPNVVVPLRITAPTFNDAAEKMLEGVQKDIYLVEQIGFITKDGYNSSVIGAAEKQTSRPTNVENRRRLAIEENLYEFMRKGQTEGFGSAGKIMFDTRTGFYVLTGFMQEGFRLTNNGEPVDYVRNFLHPLETEKQREDALLYSAMYREPTELDKFLMDTSNLAGFKKAFIFKRPRSIRKIVNELNLRLPKRMPAGKPVATLFKYDTTMGGIRVTMKRKRSVRKTQKKRGGALFDFLKASPPKEELEQESIPKELADNISAFFEKLQAIQGRA